jgi:hypothetical protein
MARSVVPFVTAGLAVGRGSLPHDQDRGSVSLPPLRTVGPSPAAASSGTRASLIGVATMLRTTYASLRNSEKIGRIPDVRSPSAGAV